ncbi:MAG: radical SAM protein [Kiritimatiellia bacterium]
MCQKVPFRMPRVIAWEVTRCCPLKCRHCRAGAADVSDPRELSTDECRRVLDSLPAAPAPMIIWTGGEPMLRPDILELVAHATARGVRSVMAPCGTLVTEDRLRALKAAGVMACSFSLDGPDAATHDAFRGVPGAYANVTRAMAIAREIGMPFQVNTTVSTLNIDRLAEIHAQAVARGAAKLDLFFLVPVGRGKGIADYALSPEQTARVLDWAFAKADEGPLAIKTTCCPSAPVHWAQWRQRHAAPPAARPPCGCLGGRGFAFLSHRGDLQTCGFIDVPCGNIRDFDCDFPALIAAAANPLGLSRTCRS